MIYEISLLIFVFVLLILGAASVFDARKREVPDFISYILIMGGLMLSLFYSIASYSIGNLVYMPLSIGLLFGFAYAMYYMGQWGGGDVKLMLGLAVVFTAISPTSRTSFISLFINILIFGGVYGLLGTLFIGAIHPKKMSKLLRKYDVALISLGVAAILYALFFLPFPFDVLISLIAFLLVSMRYIYLVADNLMFFRVEVDKLVEGDWLAGDVVEDGTIILKQRKIGLLKEDIEKLKKEGVKYVTVKVGLPFIPGVFIGALITIIFGNPLFTIIVSSIHP